MMLLVLTWPHAAVGKTMLGSLSRVVWKKSRSASPPASSTVALGMHRSGPLWSWWRKLVLLTTSPRVGARKAFTAAE